jgi:hypothetical protein
MKSTRIYLVCGVLALGCFLVILFRSPSVGFSAPGKFYKAEKLTFLKACGNGLDAGSACGNCTGLGGVAVTTGASCGHVCVTLPVGKTDKNMDYWGEGAEEKMPLSFSPCGSKNVAGVCAIQWSRFEGAEYYANTSQMCGRFKNWSSDNARIFRFTVSER